MGQVGFPTAGKGRSAMVEAMQLLQQVPEMSRQLQTVKQMMQTVARNAPRGHASGERKLRSGKKRSGNAGKQQNPSGQSVGLYGLGKTIVTADNQRLRMTFRDVFPVGNSATAGQVSLAVSLGAVSTVTANYNLGQIIPRFSTMAGLYRQFVLLGYTVEWVPAVASTDRGIVAMGFDPAPMSTTPNTYAGVIRHSAAKMFDVKTNTSVRYSPAIDRKKDPRYTTTQTGIDEDEYSFGVLQIFSTGNGLAASTSLGILKMTLVVDLLGPY